MSETPRHAPTTVGAKAVTAVRLAHAALGFLLLFAATDAIAALTITEPRQDSLTTDPSITVRGTSDSDDPVVVQLKGDEESTVEVANGKWSKPLTLFEGLNEVTVSSGGQTKVVLVTLTTLSVDARRQKVFLDWSAATTEELKKIVVGTRQATLTPPKQTAFANSVKDTTRSIMEQNFSRFAIDFVDSVAANDQETHTIEFQSLVQPLVYGESPHDCRNNTPKQTSKVFVGTFRAEMVNQLDNWKPMSKTDSVDRRILDVAHALARTASHELGHSLGLVTPKESPVCGFMEGCDLNHTCPYSSPHPLAPRFADGRYIMDDGKLAKEFTRIAEKKPQARSQKRAAAAFNTFNGDYLLLILPP